MTSMMMKRGRILTAMILFAASAAVPVAAVRAEGNVWYVKASNYGLDLEYPQFLTPETGWKPDSIRRDAFSEVK